MQLKSHILTAAGIWLHQRISMKRIYTLHLQMLQEMSNKLLIVVNMMLKTKALIKVHCLQDYSPYVMESMG